MTATMADTMMGLKRSAAADDRPRSGSPWRGEADRGDEDGAVQHADTEHGDSPPPPNVEVALRKAASRHQAEGQVEIFLKGVARG
jgi:hypothetical protein